MHISMFARLSSRQDDQLSVRIMASAALWLLDFALFVVIYWHILSRARVDGKTG